MTEGKKRVTISVDENIHRAVRILHEKTGINISTLYERGVKKILIEYGQDIEQGNFTAIIEKIAKD